VSRVRDLIGRAFGLGALGHCRAGDQVDEAGRCNETTDFVNQAPSAGTYAGKHVLITGGLGFIGLNLTTALRAMKADVRVLNRSWPPDPERSRRILDGVTFFKGDIRDAVLVEEAIAGCDLIFHLAGKSGPTASNASPLEDLDVNGRGMLTLLEACRQARQMPKIIFPSSRLVYSASLPLPVAETSQTVPLSVYGIHKLTAERYLLLYQRLYGLQSTILRITNPYGPFQRREQHSYGIVNWFIHQAVNGRPVTIYGDGSQQRDYVHIDDVVQALLLAGLNEKANGRIFNVGSGHGVSFVQMAELIVDSVPRGRLEYVEWPADAERVETGDFVADVSTIEACLGWIATIALPTGIKDVVARYRELDR
jgi:UDP-glucose 4-epimerase